jgi:hypothetical protein
VGPRKIIRDLFPANGCMGLSPAQLLIGIGNATVVDELTVRWPDGKLQSFENVPVDRPFQLKEARIGQ